MCSNPEIERAGAQGTLNHSVKWSHSASAYISVRATYSRIARIAGQAPPRPAGRRDEGKTVNSALKGDEALGLLAEPFDRQPHRVAWPEEFRRLEAGADAGRRPGRDHVARIERHEMADIADDVVDPEDQIGGVAVLPPLAIDLGPQRQLAGVGHLVGGDQPRADRAEGVGALALGPLPAALELKFTLGDVIDEAIAGDVLWRVVHRDVARLGADHDAELDLVIGLFRALRDHHVVIGAADRGGRL